MTEGKSYNVARKKMKRPFTAGLQLHSLPFSKHRSFPAEIFDTKKWIELLRVYCTVVSPHGGCVMPGILANGRDFTLDEKTIAAFLHFFLTF